MIYKLCKSAELPWNNHSKPSLCNGYGQLVRVGYGYGEECQEGKV